MLRSEAARLLQPLTLSDDTVRLPAGALQHSAAVSRELFGLKIHEVC